jgi:hypothetical protein
LNIFKVTATSGTRGLIGVPSVGVVEGGERKGKGRLTEEKKKKLG